MKFLERDSFGDFDGEVAFGKGGGAGDGGYLFACDIERSAVDDASGGLRGGRVLLDASFLEGFGGWLRCLGEWVKKKGDAWEAPLEFLQRIGITMQPKVVTTRHTSTFFCFCSFRGGSPFPRDSGCGRCF